MFTEIGAVLGIASFILIIISSIIKTFSEDKDWETKVKLIDLRCDVDFLKTKVDNLRKGKDMCCNTYESSAFGTVYFGDSYVSTLTGKSFSCKKEMVISDLEYRVDKLEERMDSLNKEELKSELKDIIKKSKSLNESDIDNIIDKLDRLVTKKG